MITGEIINPWTGGKLQLSEEIDDNSAQEGEYIQLLVYIFFHSESKLSLSAYYCIMSPFVVSNVIQVKLLFIRYDLQLLYFFHGKLIFGYSNLKLRTELIKLISRKNTTTWNFKLKTGGFSKFKKNQ